MRSKSESFSRTSVHVVFGLLIFAVGLIAVLAEHSVNPVPLAVFARYGCEHGVAVEGRIDQESEFVAMLGLGEKSYSFRILRKDSRALLVPTHYCKEPRALEYRSTPLVLTRMFENAGGQREGYFYLTNPRGELANVVHFQEGRPRMYVFVGPETPTRRAEFEAEKAAWLAQTGEIAVLVK